MKKLIRKIKSLWHGLFYGLKAADDTLLAPPQNDLGNVIMQKEVADERVGEHLIKGEVTQAVEELRYRTYTVEGESKNWTYIGDGQAVKSKGVDLKNRRRIRFSQNCGRVTNSVLEGMEALDNATSEINQYVLKFEYTDIPRFKLETFATVIDVDVTLGKYGVKKTTLHFELQPDHYDVTSKPFTLALKKMDKENPDEKKHELMTSDWYGRISALSFITYKASNLEPDYMSYSFAYGEITDVRFTKMECEMEIQWKEVDIINLTEKFYSPEMAQKYESNAPKFTQPVYEMQETAKCADCGKEISKNEAGIMQYEVGRPLCLDCYQKFLDEKLDVANIEENIKKLQAIENIIKPYGTNRN